MELNGVGLFIIIELSAYSLCYFFKNRSQCLVAEVNCNWQIAQSRVNIEVDFEITD